MSEPLEMIERRRPILAELSELGLAAARDLHERQLAAETAKDAALLANALHRISRSVRQTLALEARLDRDARRQEIEDRDEVRAEAKRRVSKRRDRIRATVERVIWTEYEDSEAEILVDDLDMLLDEEALSDAFDESPLDAHIARICEELGVAAPSSLILRSGGTPDPADVGGRLAETPTRLGSPASPSGRAEDDGDDYWRSSA